MVKRRAIQGELFGNLNYFLTMSGIFDKHGGEGTASVLGPYATCVYLCLRSMADFHTGIASISSIEIGKRIKASKPTVDGALEKLEEHGLVLRLNPDGGKKVRIYQLIDRLPFYKQEGEHKQHQGWLTAPHKPRETTTRLAEAKNFFLTGELSPEAMKAGVRIENLAVQVNFHITHHHYADGSKTERQHEIVAMLDEERIALEEVAAAGGPMAAWATRILSGELQPRHDD